MKLLTPYRLIWITGLLTIGLMSPFGSGFFLSPAAAQGEPTPIPTATPAPTWTPVGGATSTPTLTPGQTPNPTVTPSGRDVDLRPSDDTIEVDAPGSCVLFTWLAKGDIDRVEWDKEDDDVEPILVSASGERTECVDEESTFKLIVRWLNGERTVEERDVNIENNAGDGGSGGSGGSGGGGVVPTPGSFIVVTPMLITNSLAFTPFDPNSPDNSSTGGASKPEGILSTIVELPETGWLLDTGPGPGPQKYVALPPYQTASGIIIENYAVSIIGIFGLILWAKNRH